MTTKEIRAELKKELGYNARQISVRRDHSRITFTIRESGIKTSVIKDFALRYESYQRDVMTGEILCGGNTFVDVKYSDDTEKELVSSIIDEVEAAYEQVEGSKLIPVSKTDFLVGSPWNGSGVSIWHKDQSCKVTDACNTYYAALTIASA